MSWLSRGQMVVSLAGHDRGELAVVVGWDGVFALIADGKHRKLHSPKKKNQKHLRQHGEVIDLDSLTDNSLRKLLNQKMRTDEFIEERKRISG